MSQKRRRIRAEAETIKQQILHGGTWIPPDIALPAGAIPGDPSKQDPRHRVRWYYVDRPFKCADCGSEEVWTAEQQKWYYEVASGSFYAKAKRCKECRAKHRNNKGRAGGGI